MTASSKIIKKTTEQPTKKATTKGVFSTLHVKTYRALKEKFPHCSTNQAVARIIDSYLGLKSEPHPSTAYRKYKCTHPATGTVFTALNRSQVARLLNVKRGTLIKHMNEAAAEGRVFTSNGWVVTY